jgi:hypothetical protein
MLKPGSTFRDCFECPEMVVIPSGSFMMGATEAEEDWGRDGLGAGTKALTNAPPANIDNARNDAAKHLPSGCGSKGRRPCLKTKGSRQSPA